MNFKKVEYIAINKMLVSGNMKIVKYVKNEKIGNVIVRILNKVTNNYYTLEKSYYLIEA